MAIEITSTWFIAYIVLSLVSVIGLIYSYFISVKEFKSSLSSGLISTFLIDIGIILHTYAIFVSGTDNAVITELIISHFLLLAGFIGMIITGSKIREMGEDIGFGE